MYFPELWKVLSLTTLFKTLIVEDYKNTIYRLLNTTFFFFSAASKFQAPIFERW